MASGKSIYYATEMLFLVQSASAAYLPPTTQYFALGTIAWSALNRTDTMSEITAPSYARVAVNVGTIWDQSVVSGSTVTLASVFDVTWPQALEVWPAPLAVYLVDAATEGNILYGSDLLGVGPIPIGSACVLTAGNFVISES